MECPVCYESKHSRECLKFTCGHTFCKECTKTWYMKGTSSCPMCRKSLCFKGFTRLRGHWFRERQERVYLDLVTQITDELRDEYLDVVLACISAVQARYDYVTCAYPRVSCEELAFVLRATWVDVDTLMRGVPVVVYEPQMYRKFLFVNRTEYGLKNFLKFT
jgi:hypothetical protein